MQAGSGSLTRPRFRSGSAPAWLPRWMGSRWRRRRAIRTALVVSLLVLGSTLLLIPPAPAEPSAGVVVAAADISAGRTLSSTDLDVLTVPERLMHSTVITDPGPLVGRVVLGPVTRGEWLTESRLLTAGVNASPGASAMPISLADAGVVALLRPGGLIDVIWTPDQPGVQSSRVVVRAVRVLTVPQPGDDDGLLATAAPGRLVVVEVANDQALALAEASTSGSLHVLLSSA